MAGTSTMPLGWVEFRDGVGGREEAGGGSPHRTIVHSCRVNAAQPCSDRNAPRLLHPCLADAGLADDHAPAVVPRRPGAGVVSWAEVHPGVLYTRCCALCVNSAGPPRTHK